MRVHIQLNSLSLITKNIFIFVNMEPWHNFLLGKAGLSVSRPVQIFPLSPKQDRELNWTAEREHFRKL